MALVGGVIITGDDSAPLKGRAVVIRGGRIDSITDAQAIPGDVERIDVSGKTLLPGFVNLHSHMVAREGTVTARVLGAAAKAERSLAAGTTTSRDLGAPDYLDVELRDAIDAGATRGPRLVVAARPITRTGGHNHAFAREADGADEVRRAVREQVKHGADCIKLMGSEGYQHLDPHLPGLTIPEMAAAVEEAHRLGRTVSVHCMGPVATRNALLAGVDCVEHAVDGITDDVIELFLKNGTPIDSTSSSQWVVAHRTPQGDRSSWLIDRARRQVERNALGLAKCVRAGVRVAGSTDVYGTMAIEARLLHDAGMGSQAVISAITSVPAAVLGRADLGLLAPGSRADIVVLDGDPLADLAALERVELVFKDGVRHLGVAALARARRESSSTQIGSSFA